jgi:hypothetical protein
MSAPIHDLRLHSTDRTRAHTENVSECWCKPRQPRNSGKFSYVDDRHRVLAKTTPGSAQWMDALHSLLGMDDDSISSSNRRAMIEMGFEFGGVESLPVNLNAAGLKLPRQARHWIEVAVSKAVRRRTLKIAAEQVRRERAAGIAQYQQISTETIDARADAALPQYWELFWVPQQRAAIAAHIEAQQQRARHIHRTPR